MSRSVSTSSLTNAVPRSNESVTFVTRQPSFSAPTRLLTGTRTSVRNTSENSDEPSTVRSGRTSMPGVSIGRISHEMPRCFAASGSVRTRNSPKSAICPNEHQIFCPLST